MIKTCEHCGYDFDGSRTACLRSPSGYCVGYTVWWGYKFKHHPDYPNEDLRPYAHKLCMEFRAAHFTAYEIGDMVLSDTEDIVALDSIRRKVLDDSRIRVIADARRVYDKDLQAIENEEVRGAHQPRG